MTVKKRTKKQFYRTDVFDAFVCMGFEEYLERTTVCYLALHHIAIQAVRPRANAEQHGGRYGAEFFSCGTPRFFSLIT